MSEFTHKHVETNGITMHVVEAGSGFPVLLCHGFPEIWYSWRHQIRALANAGFHVIVPDQRGYGETDAPQPIEAYTIHHLVGDLTGLLDALGIGQAAIVGHDWGGLVVWQMALLAAHRVAAVVGVNTPFFARLPLRPIDMMRAVAQGNFHYILYFQEPGVAEAELEADPRRSMRLFLYAASGDAPQDPLTWQKPKTATFLQGMPEPEKLPAWLTEADLDYFTAEFARTGFRGGLNRYRNMDRDWEEIPELAGAKVTQPAIYIAGERDGVIAMNPAAVGAMKETVLDLRRTLLLPGAGHWTQQERPAEVNAALIEFLKGL